MVKVKMAITEFCSEYLRMQGVSISCGSKRSRPRIIEERRENEFVPVVPEYER